MNAFPSDPGSYDLVTHIGTGSSANVYQAFCRTLNRDLAIKVIDLERYPVSLEYLRQEVASWSSAQHRHIVSYYGSFVHGNLVYLLMEYCSGGSVADILRDSFPAGLPNEVTIATILLGVILALAHLHRHGQIHRDIKPGNTIISHDGVVKVTDFGVAASLLEEGERKHARFTRIGTPSYMAPEMFLANAGHTEKADIWSLGITAIELATGSAPYAALPIADVVQKILKAPPPQLPRTGKFSVEFRDFVRKCMNFDPKRRPTAEQLLSHAFIARAGDSSHIMDAILKDLAPIGERFAKRNRQPQVDIDAVVRRFTDETPSGKKVEWDFDGVTVVRKGRFTIRRSKSQDPPSLADAVVDAEDSEQKIARLTRQIGALTDENLGMKGEIAELTAVVQRLAARRSK
jgi:serine/threonine-protein kinase OSR1/STK39